LKKSRLARERIIVMPMQYEAWVKMAVVCREQGDLGCAFYLGKQKFVGTDMNEGLRLNQMEEVNRRLKLLSPSGGLPPKSSSETILISGRSCGCHSSRGGGTSSLRPVLGLRIRLR
jgi:hypothetical protein